MSSKTPRTDAAYDTATDAHGTPTPKGWDRFVLHAEQLETELADLKRQVAEALWNTDTINWGKMVELGITPDLIRDPEREESK